MATLIDSKNLIELNGEDSLAERRWMPIARFVIAVLGGAFLTRSLWQFMPNNLLRPTDIIGSTIFTDFDVYRYTYGYYIIAGFFPIASVVIYSLLGWRGPLQRVRPHAAPAFPIITVFTEDPPDPVGQDDPITSQSTDTFWSVTRIALPMATVGIEFAIMKSANLDWFTLIGALAACGYLGFVACGTVLLRWWGTNSGLHEIKRNTPTQLLSQLSNVNSFAALAVVPLLYFVSRSTEVVFVDANHHAVRYPWLPAWLALVLTAASVVLWKFGKTRSADTGSAFAVERNVLIWAVGPILIFLLLAVFPGALGAIQGFDDTSNLAAPQLLFAHGLVPWRDIYLLHGLLQDGFSALPGLALFGNTRWGGAAGYSMFYAPAYWISIYAFAAYFGRRNPLFIVGVGTAIVINYDAGFGAGNAPRFLLLPLLMVAFDLVLRHRGRLFSCSFMLLLFAAAILTPEISLFVPCFLIVLALFELGSRRGGAPWRQTMIRTTTCVGSGLCLLLAWTVYLIGTQSLSSFIQYFSVFAEGHNLEGSFPLPWHLEQFSLATFMWIAPTLLWLITLWRVVAKIRLRSSWRSEDWVMVVAALMSALYFPKAIDRADLGHVSEAFSVSMLLLLLWVLELLSVSDRGFRRSLDAIPHVKRLGSSFHVATAATLALLIALGSTTPVTVVTSFEDVASHFHPALQTRDLTTLPRLGYTAPGSVDIGQLHALSSVLARYAGSAAPVFDYANEPGILYYLLDRAPGTRYFYSAVAQTPAAQEQLIADLRRSRPPVVVYSATSFGLVNYDNVPQSLRSFAVTSYLLANYRPILNVRGQLVLLRNDLSGPATTPQQRTGLYFDTPACTFGDIPNFSSMPISTNASNTTDVPLTWSTVPAREVITVSGWVLETTSAKPPAMIVATEHDQVIASTVPNVGRPDVAKAFDNPNAVASGFAMTVSASGPVSLFAVSDSGRAQPISYAYSSLVSRLAIVQSDAKSITSQAGSPLGVSIGGLAGHVEKASQVTTTTMKLAVPAGLNLSTYPWLVLRGTFGRVNALLSDSAAPSINQLIQFNVLPGSQRTLYVRVGSCLQWHGYDPTEGLYLQNVGSARMSPLTVSLAAPRR